MNSKEELENFDDHVNLITFDLPHEQMTVARQFWKTLVSTFAEQLPSPRICVCDSDNEYNGNVKFSWSRNHMDRYLEIMINKKGLAEWFCSIEGLPPMGTHEDPEVIPTTQIIDLIQQYFQTQTVQVA